MVNIPTELLRTLVFVVDQRSFTKAAQSLGVTQPAVSAQIKRLQFLLGYELLDKSAPGVSLTPRGEMVVAHARRMLSVNDQIAQLGGGQPTAQTVRVAMPGDFAGTRIPATLLDPGGRVPLVSFGEDCACRYTAVTALHRIGRECDFVFTSRSIASLEAAVLAGLGIMVLPRSRVQQTSLTIWEDAPLPELPQLYCGIYLRQGGNRAALEELADDIAAVLRPQLQVRTGGAASDIAPAWASGSGQ